MNLTTEQVLKKYFGYDHFRSLQKEIIATALDKKDAIVVMPTGGGKSLCYQLPAVMLDGITVVITPLISLMKDQVDQLNQIGIPSAFINSSISLSMQEIIKNEIRNDAYKLLYVAPERLNSDDGNRFIHSLNVSMIVIDEAHCISEWGHDFRPDYRRLSHIKERFQNIPVMALTATATPKVIDDIRANLSMVDAPEFIGSFDRENLFYQVLEKEKQSYNQIISLLTKHNNQSGIIYCASRKSVEELSNFLLENNFSTLPYHAGIDDVTRSKNQDLFIRDEVRIMVATIAFGMGINKSNIRFIIHHDLPKSIENYYQETGRAGRDGLDSICYLLYNYSDRYKVEYFFKDIPDAEQRKSAYSKLDDVVSYSGLSSCRRDFLLNYFHEKSLFKDGCKRCDNCLTQFEQTDMTIPAKKFLSCIARTEERFGSQHIIDILLGSKNKKVIENNHHNLTTYGIGTNLHRDDWVHLANHLTEKKYLDRNSEWGTLSLNQRSRAVLFQSESVLVLKQKFHSDLKPNNEKNDLMKSDLFLRLQSLRKSIAEQKSVPPFVIFHDSVLVSMVKYQPSTLQQLNAIDGIGEKKLEQYGSAFLNVINSHRTQEPQAFLKQKSMSNNKNLPGTEAITLNYLLSGKNIFEIAILRKLTPSSIVNHLEILINKGHRFDVSYFISDDEMNEIWAELKNAEDHRLKPIFDKFSGKYSYDQIKLTRAIRSNS